MPLFTDPEDPAFGPAIRQLGAALRYLEEVWSTRKAAFCTALT
jgi:hypothetical protein